MTKLQKAAHEYACKNHQWLKDALPTLAGQKSFEAGGKWQLKNLWHDAQGEDLPEIDREVIVFTQNYPEDAGIMRVAIAHRPNPDGWDGRSITTGKVEHYTPKTYDKGGWNIPDVKYWLDADLPKEEENDNT
jgi:hypothetical protein